MSELFQVSSSFRVVFLRVHGYFKWIKSLTLRVHLLLVFQDVVQLDISLSYIEVAAIGLLYLILCSELAPIDWWLEALDSGLELVFDCSCCLLFPQVFTSSLRNDAHPFMVITWWALISGLFADYLRIICVIICGLFEVICRIICRLFEIISRIIFWLFAGYFSLFADYRLFEIIFGLFLDYL